jgi:stage V sporulation protein R
MRWTEREVWECAVAMGLDPFPTEFHTVPAHVLYDVAARGMPGRFSHWGHGKEYFHEITRHEHGLGRIYELVINSNPSHAFLLDVNSDVINLMVMTHVLGHTDFFKNNRAFAETARNMPDLAALRAERVRSYEERYGIDAVEQTLDALLTLELYVDPEGYAPPPGPDRAAGLPCRDLLAFLTAEAPLEDWQRDLAAIVREDGLYFWPQVRTKTINEGWASFWHGKMMHELRLTDGEFLEFARVNAGVVCAHPGSLNPYWLGLQILSDIERRFGRERLFQIRRLESDTSLVRNYLTRDLVEELGLVRFGTEGQNWVVSDDNWEQVRDGIANDFAGRLPVIQVADRDFDEKGSLLLEHVFDGRPLKRQSAMKVLGHLVALWQRPVCLRTTDGDKPVIWYHDGKSSGIRAA